MQAINEHRTFERDERRGLSFALALAVHLLLVLFLVVSVQWRTQRVETMDVELWGGPPPAAQQQVAVQQAKPQPRVEEPEPELVRKPEIVQEKTKPKEKPKPQSASPVKAEKKPDPKLKPAEQSMEGLLDLANLSKAKDARPNGRPGGTGTNPKALTNHAGAGSGGGGRPGDSYLGQVVRLIKSNLVYPDNRPDNPKAKIKVFLLPDGTIRDAQLVKSIGDPAYAEAARRAVITTHTFPPRPDGKGFSGDMREWTLSFCAKEVNECRID